jgi:5'(3')-deoxyribonucleotidase
MSKSPKKQFKAKAAKEDKIKFEIFSDMDGVLTNFDAHAKANDKFNEKGQPKWEELDFDWWKTMPAYEGAKTFFDDLGKRGNTRFLSAPILNAGCFRGKAEWIREFMRNRFGLLKLVIARAEDKNLMARPHHILVDDRQKNIDEWVAAGGIGILHKGDYADTLKRIDEAMDEYRRNHAATPPKPPVQDADKVKIFIGPHGVLTDFQSHLEAQDKIDAQGKTKWTELDPGWWKTLPAFEGAKAFFDEVKKLGATRFVTGPVPHPDSFEGDAEWAMAFRPESRKFALLDIMICRSKDKMLLARPNNILIDDRPANIDAWVKAGGIGILHKGDFADTLKRVTEAVAEYNQTHNLRPAAAAKTPQPK